MGRGKVKLQIQEWPKVRVLVVLCPLSAPRSWGGEQCCLVLGKSLPSGSADPSGKQALAMVGSSSQQIAKYLGWCFTSDHSAAQPGGISCVTVRCWICLVIATGEEEEEEAVSHGSSVMEKADCCLAWSLVLYQEGCFQKAVPDTPSQRQFQVFKLCISSRIPMIN